MPPLPSNPKDERKFLKAVRNHAAFKKQLNDLAMTSDLNSLEGSVIVVAGCWFKLAREHLSEAHGADKAKYHRSAYSRSYYAAYNASKAVRYLVYGEVSLKGDDHAKASEIPD